jgi:hypothetical protein
VRCSIRFCSWTDRKQIAFAARGRHGAAAASWRDDFGAV